MHTIGQVRNALPKAQDEKPVDPESMTEAMMGAEAGEATPEPRALQRNPVAVDVSRSREWVAGPAVWLDPTWVVGCKQSSTLHLGRRARQPADHCACTLHLSTHALDPSSRPENPLHPKTPHLKP